MSSNNWQIGPPSLLSPFHSAALPFPLLRFSIRKGQFTAFHLILDFALAKRRRVPTLSSLEASLPPLKNSFPKKIFAKFTASSQGYKHNFFVLLKKFQPPLDHTSFSVILDSPWNSCFSSISPLYSKLSSAKNTFFAATSDLPHHSAAARPIREQVRWSLFPLIRFGALPGFARQETLPARLQPPCTAAGPAIFQWPDH